MSLSFGAKLCPTKALSSSSSKVVWLLVELQKHSSEEGLLLTQLSPFPFPFFPSAWDLDVAAGAKAAIMDPEATLTMKATCQRQRIRNRGDLSVLDPADERKLSPILFKPLSLH